MSKAPTEKKKPAKAAEARKKPTAKVAVRPFVPNKTPPSGGHSEASPDLMVVNSAQPVVSGPIMKKKDLIDLVVEQSGIKKKDAKPVIEAMLAVLGTAIGEGRELNLEPMGKLKVHRAKDIRNGKMSICKLRQKDNASEKPSRDEHVGDSADDTMGDTAD
jgi:nucleoid DNA-binding protein